MTTTADRPDPGRLMQMSWSFAAPLLVSRRACGRAPRSLSQMSSGWSSMRSTTQIAPNPKARPITPPGMPGFLRNPGRVVGGVPRGLVGVPEGYFVECATLSGDLELHAGVGGGGAGLVPTICASAPTMICPISRIWLRSAKKVFSSEYYPMLNAPHLKLE